MCGTVEATLLLCVSPPRYVLSALAAVAQMPLPASKPTVAVTIAAMAPDRRMEIIAYAPSDCATPPKGATDAGADRFNFPLNRNESDSLWPPRLNPWRRVAGSLLASGLTEEGPGMVIGGGLVILIAVIVVAIMLSKREK